MSEVLDLAHWVLKVPPDATSAERILAQALIESDQRIEALSAEFAYLLTLTASNSSGQLYLESGRGGAFRKWLQTVPALVSAHPHQPKDAL